MKESPKSIEAVLASLDIIYNWDYSEQNQELRRLYHKGEYAQWIPERDINWNREVNPYAENLPDDQSVIAKSKRFQGISEKERGEIRRHMLSWTLSQFMHGEQGALLVTASMVMCVPGMDAKYYGATQVMDEARHMFVYHKYLTEKLDLIYPISPELKTLLDETIRKKNWDERFLGMQIVVEGLALSAFKFIQQVTKDREPLLHDVTRYVQQDEARHVGFGVLALRDFYKECTAAEIHERVEFLAEACHLIRERLVPKQVWERLGFPAKEMFALVKESSQQRQFQNLLFSTVVPNIKKLGLLTQELRTAFNRLGVLQFESWPSTIDFLEEPKETREAVQ